MLRILGIILLGIWKLTRNLLAILTMMSLVVVIPGIFAIIDWLTIKGDADMSDWAWYLTLIWFIPGTIIALLLGKWISKKVLRTSVFEAPAPKSSHIVLPRNTRRLSDRFQPEATPQSLKNNPERT